MKQPAIGVKSATSSQRLTEEATAYIVNRNLIQKMVVSTLSKGGEEHGVTYDIG